MYPEPLASQIHAALASEAPDDILAVADALEAAGRLEDSLEWRKWYVHLRPEGGQAQAIGEARRQHRLDQVAADLAVLTKVLNQPDVPESLRTPLLDRLDTVWAAHRENDDETACAAWHGVVTSEDYWAFIRNRADEV